MPETKHRLKVFLCHASVDKPKVRELYNYLRRRRIKPWFDEIDLVGGQDWKAEIPKAIHTSDAIIICLSKSSIDKEGFVQREIKFALDKALEMPEGRIYLIPVRFEEVAVPDALSRFQWVDLFDEAGYTRMMRSLKFRAAQLERVTVEFQGKENDDNTMVEEKNTGANWETEKNTVEDPLYRQVINKIQVHWWVFLVPLLLIGGSLVLLQATGIISSVSTFLLPGLLIWLGWSFLFLAFTLNRLRQ